MPMGSYKDFEDCVNKNKDKSNPQAYCGFIKKQVEGADMSKELCKDAPQKLHLEGRPGDYLVEQQECKK